MTAKHYAFLAFIAFAAVWLYAPEWLDLLIDKLTGRGK